MFGHLYRYRLNVLVRNNSLLFPLGLSKKNKIRKQMRDN